MRHFSTFDGHRGPPGAKLFRGLLGELFAFVTRVVATVAITSMPARAQDNIVVPTPSRIRVDLVTMERGLLGQQRYQSMSGTLVAAHSGALWIVVTPGVDTALVPASLVRAVYVSRGIPPRWRSAVTGALAPAAASALFSGISLSIHRRPSDPTPVQGALHAGASTATLFGLMGAIRPKERWQKLSWVVRTFPADPSSSSGSSR